MSARRLVAPLIAVAATLAAAPAGLAAPPVQLTEANGLAFPAKRYVLTLPARQAAQTVDLRVRENGVAVKDLQVVPAAATQSATSAVILALDTSQSMRGAPIQAAMAAARRFAAGRPAGQRLGVVFFNGEAHLALARPADATSIAKVLSATPKLGTGTRIYDATALAIQALGRTGASLRSVVTL